MSIIAHDPTDRANQILILCERLTGMVALELEAVRARRPPPDGPAAEEKLRLTAIYRQEMTRLKADPLLLAGISAAVKARLRGAAERLEQAASALAQEIAALKQISEGLVQAVAEAIQAERRGPAIYTAGGGYAQPSRSAGPLAINQKA